MKTLAALIALPFALLGLAIHLLLLPALVLGTVWLIFGTDSSVFTWTLLFCLLWVYVEYRQLKKIGSGGRRTRR
jgi:hypothetical protein